MCVRLKRKESFNHQFQLTEENRKTMMLKFYSCCDHDVEKKYKGYREYNQKYGREVIDALTDKWNGKCFYSNIVVDFEDATSPWHFSFERINNELAHTVENIQIICSFLQVGQDCQWNAQKFIKTFYHMQDIDADYEYDSDEEMGIFCILQTFTCRKATKKRSSYNFPFWRIDRRKQ